MKNNEATSVRMPQFTPPMSRKEIRSNTTSSSTMTRKEKDAERKRLQRSNETPEEKERRNEKMLLDARRKRNSESSDASLERLSKQQVIDRGRRSNETTEQHQHRLDQQQTTDITRRSNETAEQHRHRLDQQHVINVTLRSNETAEQHRHRLDQQQVINVTHRSNEIAEQHRHRLDQQQLINITHRNNETAEERTTRIRSISRRRQQRMLQTRDNPSVKIWPAAISEKVKEQCLIEFNKEMSMDSLREQICVVCNSRHNEKGMHNVLLSDINDALLKPHQSLYGVIPGISPAQLQNRDFDDDTFFSNDQGES
jgi:hypothetical protein